MNRQFFLRPLIDPRQAWSAIEIRGTGGEPPRIAEVQAIAPGLLKVLFADATWLQQPGYVDAFVPGSALFLLPQEVFATPELQDAFGKWQAKGHLFGVRDFVPGEGELGGLPGRASAVMFDVAASRKSISLLLLNRLQAHGIRLIGTNVVDDVLQSWAVARGFSLLSQEFVVRQNELAPGESDPSKLKLLKLLSLVVQDAPTPELEEIFKQEPKLSYNLMRLVNSVSMGGNHAQINSFGQAITLLGRRQLQRWLQLLIYANQFGSNDPNPLMLMAALRGRLLDALVAATGALEELPDSGFMTGIFSLLDIQLHMPMPDILGALPLPEPVTAALTRRSGVLGTLLQAVEAIERADLACAQPLLEKNGIGRETFQDAVAAAYLWVSKLNLE
jgi:EAL and modified HD-GYP domain-containing signal transduction protein